MWWKGWNGFDKCTWSKYELELENNFSSLDVLFIRIGKKIKTTIYRKPTNSDIFFYWISLALDTWKQVTLRRLLKYSFNASLISSNEMYPKVEISYVKFVFETSDNFLKWVIFQFLKKAQVDLLNRRSISEITNIWYLKSRLLLVSYTCHEKKIS